MRGLPLRCCFAMYALWLPSGSPRSGSPLLFENAQGCGRLHAASHIACIPVARFCVPWGALRAPCMCGSLTMAKSPVASSLLPLLLHGLLMLLAVQMAAASRACLGQGA